MLEEVRFAQLGEKINECHMENHYRRGSTY